MGNSSVEGKASDPGFFGRMKEKIKRNWEGVKAEFGKISWPDKDMLLKQSVAVVGVSVVLGCIIAVLDMVLQYGVDFLVK